MWYEQHTHKIIIYILNLLKYSAQLFEMSHRYTCTDAQTRHTQPSICRPQKEQSAVRFLSQIGHQEGELFLAKETFTLFQSQAPPCSPDL